jgi:cob(I)alamin adenosyltransferase
VKNTKIPDTVEEQMQKYEAQIRNHISVEQQFLLHFEAMQTKIEMQQIDLNEVSAKLDNVQNEKKVFHDIKEKEITILRDSIKDMENELKKMKEEATQDRLLGNMSNIVVNEFNDASSLTNQIHTR